MDTEHEIAIFFALVTGACCWNFKVLNLTPYVGKEKETVSKLEVETVPYFT